MRSAFFAPLVAAGLVQLASATNGCEANNCARAVTGTSDGSASVSLHRADCSAAMATAYAVTPSGVYVTETVTVTDSAVYETISTAVDVVHSHASTKTDHTTVVGSTAAITSTVTCATATDVVTATVATVTDVATVTVPATTTVQPTTTVGWGWGNWGKHHWKRDGAEAATEAAIDDGDVVFQRLASENEPTSPAKKALKGRTYESTMSLASGVPTYAYYCTDYAAYTRACSCWGITAQTATASGATVTATRTVTVTPTVSVVATVTSVDADTVTTVATETVATTKVVVVSVTATSTRTVPVTATVSSTATLTKTVTVTGGPTCTKKEVVPTATPTSKGGSGSCSFNVYSSKGVSPRGGTSSVCRQSSVDGCLNACGKDKSCNVFSFEQSSGKCTLHSGVTGFSSSPKLGSFFGCLKATC